MSHRSEKLAALQKARHDVNICVMNLIAYEQEVTVGTRDFNNDFHAILQTDLRIARSAMSLLETALDIRDTASLAADDIELIREQIRIETTRTLAQINGWNWNESIKCWETYDGKRISETGELLP